MPLLLMITIVGSINYDLVTTTEIIPNGGDTVHAIDFETHHGGKGANTALAVAKLSPKGTQVSMVGKVGKDEFGPQLIKGLQGVGVDTTHVKQIENERTGVATILVETSGENRILVYPGANAKVVASDLPQELAKKSDYLIFQNEIPVETTLAILEQVEGSSTKTVYNPSPIKDLPPKIWGLVDILAVNASEAATISGQKVDSKEDAEKAVATLFELGIKEIVVVTLGAHGAVFGSKASGKLEVDFVPTAKVDKVVDTTGAGDTFLSGIVARLAQNDKLKDAVEFATKASAIVVTRPGAADSVPWLAEISS